MDRSSSSRNSWEYVDFDLEIGEGGPRKYPISVRSPAGEAREEMRFPFDDWELKGNLLALENALLRSGGTRRRIPLQEEQPVQDFGQGLLQALLVGEVRTRYAMSLREARRQNKGLRVKLRIHPPDLARLPWEFLYDPDRDEYLCLSSKTPLVRYLDLLQSVEQLPVSPPLRILGMVSSPLDLLELDVEHEKRLMEEAIKDLRRDGLVEMTWLEGQTWTDLQQAMWGGPWHVFHFIGHGGFDEASEEGAIALASESGRKHLLGARNLARLLDDHYSLRLAFLNSCEGARGSVRDAFSSTAATLVRRGIPAVIAMQYEITDRAAISFASAFYRAVANGLPVDAAVATGRTAVSMESALEWGIPVLYTHAPDGHIFDTSTRAPHAQPTPETEDRQEGDLQRRYREGVKSAWADGVLGANEVQQLRDLASNELRLSPDTAADIEREVMSDTKEAILERQEEAAREEERNRQLEQLYTQANRLHRDRKWQAVIDVLERIRAEDPAYPDPEGLLRSANEALQRARAAASEEEAHDATDAARQKAEELGLELSKLEGSGAGGRIIVKDVVSAAQRTSPRQTSPGRTSKKRTSPRRSPPGQTSERRISGSQRPSAQKPHATESAKQKADELGVDLSKVEGTGAEGRITVKDVTSAAYRPIRSAGNHPSRAAPKLNDRRPWWRRWLAADVEREVISDTNAQATFSSARVTMDVRKVSNKVSVIDVKGALTAFAEGVLMKAYTQASEKRVRVIILNFEDLEYLDSSGIGLLVTLLIRINREKQQLLAYGLSDHYRSIFQITRLDDGISIYDSEEAAVQAADSM